MAGDDQKSLAAGMNGHVTKPIDPEQLFTMLLKWIEPRDVSTDANPTGKSDMPNADEAAPDMEKDAFPPALPGFDLVAGLRRLQGNEKLYAKLLVNFATQYAGLADDIRRAINSGDFVQTHGLVHSLKGMAGNLAAAELHSAAIDLEKLVKPAGDENRPATDELERRFAGLDAALNQTIQSIRDFWPLPPAKSDAAESGVAAPLPPELAREAANRLRDAAEMGDISGVVSAVDELESRSNAFAHYRNMIAQLADEFDIDGLLKLAKEFDAMAD
jgi:HPt (histidine-containing phosphotransfer) domain-containing protein